MFHVLLTDIKYIFFPWGEILTKEFYVVLDLQLIQWCSSQIMPACVPSSSVHSRQPLPFLVPFAHSAEKCFPELTKVTSWRQGQWCPSNINCFCAYVWPHCSDLEAPVEQALILLEFMWEYMSQNNPVMSELNVCLSTCTWAVLTNYSFSRWDFKT